MVKPYQRTLKGATYQLSYAGVVKTDTIALPTDYAIQRIFLELRGTFDTSAATTLVSDAGQLLMKSIRVEITGKLGSKTVFSMNGNDLFIKNFYDFHVQGKRVVPSAATTAGQVFEMDFCIDFRLAKHNPDDFSVALPSWLMSTLNLVVDWDTPANGYGTNSLNWALTGYITLFEGIPETTNEKALMEKAPLLTQLVRSFQLSSDTVNEEIRDRDVAVGGLIRRIFLICQTSSNVRDDGQVSYTTIYTPQETLMDKLDWKTSKSQDKFDYELIAYDGNESFKGVNVIDFARQPVDLAGNLIGFNATGMKVGDFKINYMKLVASPFIRYLQEQIEA